MRPTPWAILTAAVPALLPGRLPAMTLVTEHYVVTIESGCEEGEVSCDRYTYTGVNRRTGQGITLTGSSMHTRCQDGTPCRFLGYRFENGTVVYTVSQEGILEVVEGRDRVLLHEEGAWREE